MTLWDIFAPLWQRIRGGTAPPTANDVAWTRHTAALGHLAAQLPYRVVGDRFEPVCVYRHYRKRKKGGGYREISEPEPRLKQLQQLILTRYLDPLNPHPAAVAYRRGQSTADHVWSHAGCEILITVDLADFFPSTTEVRIDDWWHQQISEPGLARLLTQLTVDGGSLPQGAPTSPALSNLVNYEMDERLCRRAEFAGARYTRYCDDLAFSWPRGAEPPADFRPAITSVLLEFGYRLHPVKGWCVYQRCDEPEVTGAVLARNGRVRLPNRLKQVMARLARSAEPQDGQRLAGYQAYEAMLTRKRKPTQAPRHPGVPLPPVVPIAPFPPTDLAFDAAEDRFEDEDEYEDEGDDEKIPF